MFARIKSWVTWSWTYLWALWFLLVIALVYILRGPLKISESLESGLCVCVPTDENYIFSISLSEQFDTKVLRGIDGHVQFGVGHYINI